MDEAPRDLPELLRALREASSQEASARVLLSAVLALAEEATSLDRGSHLLHGALYLHSEQGYRGMILDERTPTGAALAPHDQLPSQTAWRWLVSHGEAVFINVASREVGPADPDSGTPHQEEAESRPHESVSKATRELLAAHEGTHLYGVPVRRDQGSCGAMLVIAWRCPVRAGAPLLAWEEIGAQVQMLTDVAAPWLLSRAPMQGKVDLDLTGMPVVGLQMRPVLTTLRTFARGDANLLLTGPSGVGKTRLARWAHDQSARKGSQYRELHLQRYRPDTLLAYLFGWERGAFTDARQSYAGEVAQADGGTLFLDEIGELPTEAQSQLLQFLLTHSYRRLGHRGQDAHANVRIIAATNRDLAAAVRDGSFREDLYYRLAARPVSIPGLSERRDEIASWSTLFANGGASSSPATPGVEIEPEALAMLEVHSWPGNLHDLNNIVGMARELADGDEQGPTRIKARHVVQALGLQPSTGATTTAIALRSAAQTWLDELARRCPDGLPDANPAPPLGWSDCKGLLRSYLLLEAIGRYGLKDAFIRLGAGARVEGRSYNREETLARSRIAHFEAGLG